MALCPYSQSSYLTASPASVHTVVHLEPKGLNYIGNIKRYKALNYAFQLKKISLNNG